MNFLYVYLLLIGFCGYNFLFSISDYVVCMPFTFCNTIILSWLRELILVPFIHIIYVLEIIFVSVCDFIIFKLKKQWLTSPCMKCIFLLHSLMSSVSQRSNTPNGIYQGWSFLACVACRWCVAKKKLGTIGLLMSVVSTYHYVKTIKLLMTGWNRGITPHVRNYIRSPLRSNSSIE